MIDEQQVIDILAGDGYDRSGLDPDVVIAGARHRRSRKRLTAAASVAAALVAGFVAIGGLGTNSSGGPVGRATSPTPSASVPVLATAPQPYGFDPYQPPKAIEWKPFGRIGAQPVGRIPANRWVQILPDQWLATSGTSVCQTSGAHPGPLPKPAECRGTIGNRNYVSGLHNMATLGHNATSVFEGSMHRVIYAAYDGYVEAKLYRFDAIPGWMLAAARLPDELEPPAQSVFGYDEKNRLRARFTVVDSYPKPINDPLHQR